MQIKLRAFLPTDLPAIEALCAQVFRGDLVRPESITCDFVSAADHDAANLIVAGIDGGFAGFALLAGDPFEGGVLWLVAFGVVPQYRGSGVGKALVSAAVARARDQGHAEIKIGAVPTRYLVPGVNRQAHPEAYDLLTKHFSFRETATVCSMTCRTGDTPPAHSSVNELEEDEIPILRAFLVGQFHPAFWDYVATSLRDKPTAAEPPPVVLIVKDGQAIVGMVHLRGSRFGPLAVHPSARGLGLGRKLTIAALNRSRLLGHDEIYFMIAEEEIVPFYRRLGFIERCRYSQLSRKLTGPQITQ